MDNPSDRLTLREFPIFEWLFSLAFLAFAVNTMYHDPSQYVTFLVILGVSLLFMALSAILVVRVDRTSGTLTIWRISLLRYFKREIPLSEVESIQLESSSSYSSSSHRRTTTYRIVAITKEKEVIPFRTSYSSGRASKDAKVWKLREFIGLSKIDTSIGGMFQAASSVAAQQFKQEQESITGEQDTYQVTDGVHWKLDTKAMGGSPISRWFSPDYQMADSFAFVTQKMQGQPSQGGLMSVVGKMLFKTSLSLYGFPPDLTPGLDNAEMLVPLDSQLEPYFMAYTSYLSGARQLLNPWTAMPLAAWAQKYPLKQGNNNQLAILFCPQGVYVAMMGLVNPEFLQELTALGVEIVKALGGGSKT